MSRRGEKPKSIADGRFEIETKLGEGSFGEVYRGTDKRTQQKVAIKFEEGNTSAPGSLKNEAYLLDMLRRPYQRHGFVEVLHFSRIGRYSVLVMELLGQSLEDCMSTSGGKFSIGTTTLIAEQSLHRIEYLHSKCIVHRDIKPDNFLWGTGRKAHHLYLIDFGLSVKWSGLKAKTQEEKFRKIADTKERYPLADLCKGFPDEFRYYLQYCRNLGFKERPDYAMLQKNFRELRKREGIVEDYELQFINPNEVDVKTLIPMDPGCGHQQPDDAPGRTSKHCFYWRRSVVPSIPKDKE
eukprot:CAMPEP_0206634162 /NCGR_PEP_ID=MMETSP0325_2-20121206/69888_1 /ASSEMBLY_ACC=CAM_ASM_000347 /TAXON_ID=2866 /ORGANISM="Crypthecodinium cohnii, Strain Seligo" /LENGTH=294 /DNA_ID=CAMNT_0054159927 /DNA_START=83 /DNA_END=968 /DNA_ORIENTATION=-